MSNFLKNLHPLLRRKKNPKDNEDVNYALIKVLNEEMNLIETDAIESKLQSSLKSSTGTYLDNFGDWFGVYRKKDEEDDKYRARIIKYLLLKRGTNNAIIEAIKDYLEDSNADVSIYEPFRNIFYTNKSHLNGHDHLMGYYYNFAIINVSIGSYFPMEIVDVINEFKPAGVKFYVTYDGGGTNTGSSIIKVLDEPVNIDVYQNIDRLSGYSETFYGHINMGLRKVSYNSKTDIFKTNHSKMNSSDVLTGSSSIGRAFHNYAYKTNYMYNPTRKSTVSEIKTVLDEKGRELPLEYYINTTEKGRAPVAIDIDSTTGTSFIYNNLNLREYFSQYKPELIQGDNQDIRNNISSYVGSATFDLFMEALVSPDETIGIQTQVFDFSIGKWVTINNSKITYGIKNVGAELGYIKDYMNNELNLFTRVAIVSSSDVTIRVNYLDLMFYHYTPDVYTVKPYKGLIEYYIELDRLSYVDAFKVASLNNGDIISKLGYEPMGYVRVVGESNEPKNIIHINDTAEPPTRMYDFQLITDENDVFNYRDTKYLIEFDISGEDSSFVKDLYVYPAFILEDFSDYNIINSLGVKVSITNTKGRAIVEVPSYVDFETYHKMFIQLSTYNYQEKEDLKPGEVMYADAYKISFNNITVQDIYESTDQAPDPTTRKNNAFVDTRLIDGTPGRGNSGQDGNILNNEAYTLASPAVYNKTKYDILTNLTLRKPIETGKTYTVQIKGNLGSDRTSWLLYNSNGLFNELYGQSGILPSDYDPKTGIYTKTFIAPKENYDGTRTRLNTSLRVYQYPSSGTSQSTIEWVKVEEGSQATKAGYQYAYYTMAYLPKGKYDIYYKAKVDVLEGDLDMVTILDYPNSESNVDPKFLVPIENGYVKGKISVNRTDTEGRLLIYAGLAGSTAGNKIRFSELEVYYSTDTIDSVENEIILKDSSGNVLPAMKVDTQYTTANSVYNGQKTYNHSVMLYGSYTNIAEIEFKGRGKVDNLKLQYTRYPIPSSWNTLYEASTIEPNPDSFSIKYDNELKDLYGLELIDYSRINAFSTIKLQSLWDTTIGEITSSEGSFTDMPNSYFNATWQYVDRLDIVTIGKMDVLDDIAGGIIDNSTQTVTTRRKPTISQYTDLTDTSTVYPLYTEDITMGSPRKLYELREVTMTEETIEIDRRAKVIDTYTEQEPNTNILIDSYKTREIVGSGFADYKLKEPIEQSATYNVKITGNFKEGLERIAVGNSNGSFNEVFIYPSDIKNGVVNKTYTARLDQYAEGKQRLNNDYRLYIQPYTSDSSIIYSVELRKL
uniref:Virion structural protein n=1 Tax=Mammaliicoccus phage MSShimriz1 TaxID=3230127 RepID=A0AAU8GUL7_9VIRU